MFSNTTGKKIQQVVGDHYIPILPEVLILHLVIHHYLVTLLDKITVHLEIAHCIAIQLAQ